MKRTERVIPTDRKAARAGFRETRYTLDGSSVGVNVSMNEDSTYAVRVTLTGLKDPNLTNDTVYTGDATKDARLLKPVSELMDNIVADVRERPLTAGIMGRKKLEIEEVRNNKLGADSVGMTLTLPRPGPLGNYAKQTQELYRRVVASLDARLPEFADLPAFEVQMRTIQSKASPKRDVLGQTANERVAQAESRALGGLDMEGKLTAELMKRHGLPHDVALACAHTAGEVLEEEGNRLIKHDGQRRLADTLVARHGLDDKKAQECAEAAVEQMRRCGLIRSEIERGFSPN